MKRWIPIVLAVIALQATAQDSVSPYRQNDPFVFCTEGWSEQRAQACWWPSPPYTTGMYIMNPSCRPPNKYGRDWSSDDYRALSLYQSVCPRALKNGSWGNDDKDLKGKRANNVPSKH
jgi:hypothetical protein